MLVELIVELLELPLMFLGEAFQRVSCPKCGNRLKHAGRVKTGQFKCVMCEQSWRREGRRLVTVDADN